MRDVVSASVLLTAVIVSPATALDGRLPRPVDSPSLPNAQWVSARVISGGTPVGEKGFAELARLGVQTVLSVDGATPDVALAKQHGLRYVHLPHGYDGVPADRAIQLSKAVRDLPAPIYIHCHHGKHRSPAAAAVACVGAGQIERAAALAVLKSAGTSPHYRGLYQSAQDARRFTPELLDSLPAAFPESSPAPPMVEAMVSLEHAIDRMHLVEQARWQAPPTHPDVDPAHEALMLREHFTELLRTQKQQQPNEAWPEEFWAIARRSEAAARRLEASLNADQPSVQHAARQLAQVAADCKACHAKYRDVPR